MQLVDINFFTSGDNLKKLKFHLQTNPTIPLSPVNLGNLFLIAINNEDIELFKLLLDPKRGTVIDNSMIVRLFSAAKTYNYVQIRKEFASLALNHILCELSYRPTEKIDVYCGTFDNEAGIEMAKILLDHGFSGRIPVIHILCHPSFRDFKYFHILFSDPTFIQSLRIYEDESSFNRVLRKVDEEILSSLYYSGIDLKQFKFLQDFCRRAEEVFELVYNFYGRDIATIIKIYI